MSSYNQSKKRLIDKWVELLPPLSADIDVPIVSERLNGFSKLDRVLLDYFASEGREHCQKLLDKNFKPRWHCIQIDKFGNRLFGAHYDTYNVAISQREALGFVFRLLGDCGLPLEIVFNNNGKIIIKSDDGIVAQIYSIEYHFRDNDGARRVTNALKHLHEYEHDAKIAARLKRIPGLLQCDHHDRAHLYLTERICIHRTANNFAHNMRSVMQQLLGGKAPDLHIAQEVLAAYMGAGSWLHLKAAEKENKIIDPPYLLLTCKRGEDDKKLGFYSDKAAAIWAFAVLLRKNSEQKFNHDTSLSNFSNNLSARYDTESSEEVILVQPEDVGANDVFTQTANHLIDCHNESGEPVFSTLSPNSENNFSLHSKDFVRCPLCDFSYAYDIPQDHIEHQKFHNECKLVEEFFQLELIGHVKQELEKKIAHRHLRSDDPIIQKRGAMNLIRAHFLRSLLASVRCGDWQQHPQFETYIAMTDDYESIIPSSIMLDIRKTYGKIEGAMAIGSSYWRLGRM